MRKEILEGTFFEIGEQYGHLFKRQIRTFNFMMRLMSVVSEGEGRDFFRPKPYHFPAALFQMRKYRRIYQGVAEEFKANIQQYYPEILDVMKGMAKSTQLDYRDILFMNCLIEYRLKCSTIGAAGKSTAQGGPLLAMNADETKFVENYEVLLDIKPTKGYRFIAVFMAGVLLPNFGMNETGLSMASQLLFLDNSGVKKLRMPTLLKYSILHRCQTVQEAIEVLEPIPPAGIGSSIFIADANQLLVSEENYAAKKIQVYDNGQHYNGNLPLFDEMAPYTKLDKLDDIQNYNAIYRHRRLKNLLQQQDGNIREEVLYKIIADHGSTQDNTLNKSICVHPKNTQGIKTVSSFIANPREKSMRIFEGNPCQNKVSTHGFD